MELREDNVGLYASAAVTDPETVKAAREGRLTGWSFGFCCLHDSWRKDDDGLELRELDTIRLDEVSILTKSPAYIATSVEVRDEELIEQRAQPDTAELAERNPRNKTDNSVYRAELELLSLGGKRI